MSDKNNNKMLAKEFEQVESKIVYCITVNDFNFVMTYDIDKAIELYKFLSSGSSFFKIATGNGSLISEYDFKHAYVKASSKNELVKFFHKECFSEDGGLKLQSTKLIIYPNKELAESAQNAFEKIAESLKHSTNAPKDLPF